MNLDKSWEMLWRAQMASERLNGAILAKTSGALLAERKSLNGWLYIGPESLVFIGDGAIYKGIAAPTNADRILHLTYQELGRSTLRAPFWSPNGIITFANGIELMGQKNRMKVLHGLTVG